jgi:hypothetical protein
MQIVRFQNAPQTRPRRQVGLRLELESETQTPAGRRFAKNDPNVISQRKVARRFMRMDKAHERIRKEILGVSHTNGKGFAAKIGAARAVLVRKKGRED